jgi:DNA-binding transcriptional regulator YdaS (Cro superfamily)
MQMLSNLLAVKASSMSQVAFAKKVGVRQSTVSGWMRGVTLPPSTRLPALAAAIGVDVAELQSAVDHDRQTRGQSDLTGVDGDHAPIISGGGE